MLFMNTFNERFDSYQKCEFANYLTRNMKDEFKGKDTTKLNNP